MPKIIYHDSDGIDKTVNLGADPVLIGRATECQIQTQDAMVSRRHARIVWDGNYVIEDLGSSNGVYVGNDKVQRAPIRPGDTVTCGSLVLKLVPDTSPRTSERMPGPMTGALGAAPPPMAPPPMAARAAPPPAAPMPAADWPLASTMAPPPASAPPPVAAPVVQVGPNAVLRGAIAAPTAATGQQNAQVMVELGEERRRRQETEGALLQAESRAKSAEDRAHAAETKAAEFEAAARDANLLKRKVDQLTADMRRLRGGKEPEPAASDDGDRAARLAAESERDRLRQRVADLEAEVARGGASTGAAPAGDSAEAVKLKRQVDQLTAELRRVRGGAPADAGGDAARIAELTAELKRAEAERDSARSAPAVARTDPAAADAAVALSDALAELRSSLRAATDEAAMLTAPTESVGVVSDALRTAAEQLEGARTHLRALGKILGVA